MEKKKRFENPGLEIMLFTNDDIITKSGEFGDEDPDSGSGDLFPRQ